MNPISRCKHSTGTALQPFPLDFYTFLKLLAEGPHSSNTAAAAGQKRGEARGEEDEHKAWPRTCDSELIRKLRQRKLTTTFEWKSSGIMEIAAYRRLGFAINMISTLLKTKITISWIALQGREKASQGFSSSQDLMILYT
eukprot:scaffold141966_cov18-Tisochrysis_lutea.AAC.1